MTQEEINEIVNKNTSDLKLVAIFMDCKKDIVYWGGEATEVWGFDHTSIEDKWNENNIASNIFYDSSMDWLYPVYQKIVQYGISEEIQKLDSYTRMLLHEQEAKCAAELATGNDVSIIFEEIVEWIKIYNLKVLEDENI